MLLGAGDVLQRNGPGARLELGELVDPDPTHREKIDGDTRGLPGPGINGEQVPAAARPQTFGDPNYVQHVLNQNP